MQRILMNRIEKVFLEFQAEQIEFRKCLKGKLSRQFKYLDV